MSIRSIKNSIIGRCEPDQLPNTNKYTRGLIEASYHLRDKLESTGKKRIIIPLALPVGLARGVMYGMVYPAMIIDRVANVIRIARHGHLPNSENFKKFMTLPIKVIIIACAVPTGFPLIPVFAIAYTISTLAHCKGLNSHQK